jgi:hypothetical protein
MILWQPITLSELLSLIISVAGFITVIITLALLIRQTREMTTQTKYVADSLKSSAYENLENRIFAVNEVFINSPELRPYFKSGKDINEKDPAYNKVMAIADMLLDFLDSLIMNTQRFPQMYSYEWWNTFAIDSFANSPVLCKYLESNKDWYNSELIELMVKGNEKRAEMKVKIKSKKNRSS